MAKRHKTLPTQLSANVAHYLSNVNSIVFQELIFSISWNSLLYNTRISSKVPKHCVFFAEIYRPGDFIVLKLDIDNVPLETQFMNMIEDNFNLVHMIAEMFFEEHFNDDGKFQNLHTQESELILMLVL